MANDQQPTVRLSFGSGTRPPQAAPPPPPPSDSYYVFAENRSFGPVPSATIRQWITEKRVSGETQAQRAGTNEWIRIAEMPEFAGQISPPTPPSTPPPTSQPAATASAQVDTYYIRTAERQYDPAPLSDIRRWITENRIPFDAMVRRVGTDEWKRIDELTATLAAQVAQQSVSVADECRYVCEMLGTGLNNFLIAQTNLQNLSSSIMDQVTANPTNLSSLLIDNLSEFIVAHDKFTCAYEALNIITPPLSLLKLHKEVMKAIEQGLAWGSAMKEFMLLGAKNQIQEAQIQCVNLAVLSAEWGISQKKILRMAQEKLEYYQKMRTELQERHGK